MRRRARRRLTGSVGALDHTLVAGVRSNVAFLASLCRAEAFRRGKVDTGFIDRNLAALGAVPHPPDKAAAALGVAHLLKIASRAPALDDGDTESASPWAAQDGFQLGGVRSVVVPVVIDGESAGATVTYAKNVLGVAIDGVTSAADAKVFVGAGDDQEAPEAYVLRNGRQTRVRIKDFSAAAVAANASDGVIKAPIHGKVLELLAGVGDRVASGQRLAVIEAMKMEHTLRAPFAAVVMQVPVSAGAQVVEGAQIMVLEPLKDLIK